MEHRHKKSLGKNCGCSARSLVFGKKEKSIILLDSSFFAYYLGNKGGKIKARYLSYCREQTKKSVSIIVIGAILFLSQGFSFLNRALAAVPNAPSNLTATPVSPTQINLSWQDNSTNETSCELERSLSASSGYSKIADIPANTTTYQDQSGLAEGTTYYYRIRAANSDGYSGYSNIADAKTLLYAPTELKATQYSNTQVNLTWKDNSSAESSYKVERSTTGVAGPWTLVASLGTNATAYSDKSASGNNNYCYRVYPFKDGITIISYSNVACLQTIAPVWIGKIPTIGSGCSVAISGNYGYVTSNLGLQVLDITNFSQPLILGTVDLISPFGIILANNDILYVGDSGTLKTIDITDKNNPKVIASVNLSTYTYGFDLVGSTLYAANYSVGVRIIDVSDPKAPQVLRTIATPGQAKRVAVRGTTAVVADGTAGLQIIDLTTNQIISSVPTTASALDVKIKNNYAYVAEGDAGFTIFDITNPTSPQKVATAPLESAALGLALSDIYAYVAIAQGLYIFDVSNPLLPIERSLSSTDGRNSMGGVAAENNKVLFAAEQSGVTFIDARNVDAPETKAVLPRVYKTTGVAAHSNTLVIAFHSYVTNLLLLYIYDISTPSFPRHKSTFRLDDAPFDVVLDNSNHAFVATGKSLTIVDVSDLSNPFTLGKVDLPDYAYRVFLSDNKAYVADYNAGVVIVDISNLTAPTISQVIDTPGRSYDVAVDGDTAVVADGSAGIRVFSLINPASAVVLNQEAYTVKIDSQTKKAYAGGSRKFLVVDITDPSSPSIIETANTREVPSDIVLQGNKAIVANSNYGGYPGGNGLQIFDIANPADIYETSFHSSPGLWCWAIDVYSHYVYAADDKFLVNLLNLNGPATAPNLTKSADKTSVKSGEIITYAFTLSNPTVSALTNLTLTDSIPQGTIYISNSAIYNGAPVTDTADGDAFELKNGIPTWTIPNLPAAGESGSSVSFSFKVRVE